MVPICELAGQLGLRLLGAARACCAAAAIVGLRAVGDAAQVGGQAGRHREVELAEELVAVFAVELQGEAS